MATVTLLGDQFQPYTIEVPDPPPPGPGSSHSHQTDDPGPGATSAVTAEAASDAVMAFDLAGFSGAPPAAATSELSTVATAPPPALDDATFAAAYAAATLTVPDSYFGAWADGQGSTYWNTASPSWAEHPISWGDTDQQTVGFWLDANGWWDLG